MDKASTALQALFFEDEYKALDVLSPDFKMIDEGGIFSNDVNRLRKFLSDITLEKGRSLHIAPWGYAGKKLNFSIGFQSADARRVSKRGNSYNMSIWVQLSDRACLQQLELQYRPEALISAVSSGMAERSFRLLLFRMGLFRLGRSRIPQL